ncbi:alpha/beta hydrolase fold domain-containing protein, partial [Parasphingorhabdus sp.]
MIDPHIQAMLEAMAESGFQLPDPLEPASLRLMLDAPIPAPPVEIAERRDISIDADGAVIAGRLYHPAPEEILPVVLFFHGGGWVHGSLDTHDRLAAILAEQG